MSLVLICVAAYVCAAVGEGAVDWSGPVFTPGCRGCEKSQAVLYEREGAVQRLNRRLHACREERDRARGEAADWQARHAESAAQVGAS